jgi:hypothetical protein
LLVHSRLTMIKGSTFSASLKKRLKPILPARISSRERAFFH